MDAVKIDFGKTDGLVAGIVQDAKTGEMLMLGFLNEESYSEDAGERVCDVLVAKPQDAVDEGRDERQSAEDCERGDRL